MIFVFEYQSNYCADFQFFSKQFVNILLTEACQFPVVEKLNKTDDKREEREKLQRIVVLFVLC